MSRKKQLHWEDVQVGSEVPPLLKVATTQMLIKWAGANGDFLPVHYDHALAVSRGFIRPIVHGPLKRAWLVQMLTDWMGDGGSLRHLSCQFRAVDYPRPMKDFVNPQEGETWSCKGKVTRSYVEAGEHLVDCEIWIENGHGDTTTRGWASIVLPSLAESMKQV